ncbi:MAG: carboxypeptidase regulatory-like domain-containing protein [Bryobacterales bacterium]|nr:carboxypeptidase regulatory-like domain-containing protein [Bryobacterales bacterium]
MKSQVRILACTLLALALCVAQTGTGNIQGTIKDVSGAVLPGAKVTLLRPATNETMTTQANDAGFFLFPALRIGSYELTVEQPGLAMWKATITLIQGQTADLSPALVPGATSTEVTVASNITPLVTTTSPTLATVVERARIDQLPLNGRNVTSLIYMTTPGVESGGVPRMYGLRFGSEVVQDGAPIGNRYWASTPDRQPGLDTIDELRVETSNSSAKLSRPGAVILTTRSGTNEVHGSLFETARNSGIGVARARTDYYTKPPHLVRNEFGASIGGPVYLPKLYNGRNRTFFFFAYEGYRLRQSTTRYTSVPTEAMWNGDLSNAIDPSTLNKLTIYNPYTTQGRGNDYARLPFPNNVIPISMKAPLTKYLQTITPAATTGDNPFVQNNYFGQGFSNGNQTTITVKIDQRVNDANNLSFRYTHSPSFLPVTSDPYGSGPAMGNSQTGIVANAYVTESVEDNGVGTWNHTFSPTFFSETRATVTQGFRTQRPYNATNFAAQLGLPNPFGGVGFPRIPYTLNGSAGGAVAYDASINTNTQNLTYMIFDQDFTKIKGRHELLFGGRVRYDLMQCLEDQQTPYPQVNFASTVNTGLLNPATIAAGTYAAYPYTGSVAANFFMGLATYSTNFRRGPFPLHNNEKALYFQDNWKVNDRLTLNFGLRYEFTSPVNIADNSVIGFNPATKKIVLGNSIDYLTKAHDTLPQIVEAYAKTGVQYETNQQAGLPSTLVYANYWDFGPRVGGAYRVTTGHRPLVFRSGFGIYGYPDQIRSWTGVGYSGIPQQVAAQVNPNSAALSPDGLPNYWLRSAPTIIAGQNSANVMTADNIVGVTPGSGPVVYLDPHQPTSRALAWTAIFEKEVYANTVVKTGFAGTRGFRLMTYYSYNDAPAPYVWYVTTGQPLPTGIYSGVATRPWDNQVYGQIQQMGKYGWSNDVTFQAEVQHRFSKGYAFQVFYAMSNALRAGGNGWSDQIITTSKSFLPGRMPAGDAPPDKNLIPLERFQNYSRDTAIPKHRINWNGIYNLPFGKDRKFASNGGRLTDALIGGWQVAFFGQLYSRYFALGTGNLANFNPVQYYGKKYPTQDCRSGNCYNGYLMWNGYIPGNLINATNAAGKCVGICGIPANYKPYATPLIPYGQTTLPANAPENTNVASYWNTNTVWVPLQNGAVAQTTIGGFLDPFQKQYMLGPWLWNMSASVFKEVNLAERVRMRINADFLNNVFNMPGTNLPGSNGLESQQSSANSPRVLQLTMRLTF